MSKDNNRDYDEAILHHKGYKGTVEFCMLDMIFYGKLLDVGESMILYDGKDLIELNSNFKKSVENHIEYLKRLGQP